MLRRLSSFFVIFLFSVNGFAQQADTSKYGKITYIQDDDITRLINKHIICSENSKTISGFRVQIHFGSEREKAKEIKTRFLKSYPDYNAYEIYQQPNFKIRVGDFRTRLEAQKFQRTVAGEFSSSFVVPDEIQLPEIK